MVLKNLFILFFLFIISSQILAQEYTLIQEIPINGRLLRLDNFGNSYVVTSKNELQKFDKSGTPLQFYNEFRFGKIAHVDVSNPMKKIVFFARYQTIRILDVTLSAKGTMSLLNLGFDKVNAVCQSLDNQIWIYDEISFKLKKINDRLEVIQESENLSTLLQENIKPNYVLEKDNILMLNDPEIGILVFDIYTTYLKTIPIKGLTEFQKIKDFIYYFQDGELHSFHTKTLEFKTIKLPDVTGYIINVKIEAGLLSVLTEDRLLLFSY